MCPYIISDKPLRLVCGAGTNLEALVLISVGQSQSASPSQHAVWILPGQDRLEEMFIKATPNTLSEQRVEVTWRSLPGGHVILPCDLAL